MITSSEQNGEEDEEDEEEDEELLKFQQKMDKMHMQAAQNQQKKISFDGQWIDSLKQRL